MKILITGSKGFVGKNLVENLKNIRDGKNRTRPNLRITEIFEYHKGSGISSLQTACEQADFVFHLAGVNRPKDMDEFMNGNFGFGSMLLDTLKKRGNTCPVMVASSIQASLAGRFAQSEYGKNKLAGEKLFLQYGKETGAKIFIYRFPNLFGKWCKPNYNSVVATFCNAVANDLEYTVNDPTAQLELLYIDDLVDEMLDLLEGREHRWVDASDGIYGGTEPMEALSGRYCYVPTTYRETLGGIVDLLKAFKAMPSTLAMPYIPDNSFAKKLYSTYLSYLPEREMWYCLNRSGDSRGVFAELMKTEAQGQISINIAYPGITRGQHWHNSKWEIFMVVHGHGLIQERKIGVNPSTGEEYPVISFEVTGEQMKAVQMLPGYAHSITNLSETENLVTVMWANEPFDEKHPDTFYESVVKGKGAAVE